MNGATLDLPRGKRYNGFFRTKGEAEVKLSGEDITSVRMRGEIGRAMLRFTDKK